MSWYYHPTWFIAQKAIKSVLFSIAMFPTCFPGAFCSDLTSGWTKNKSDCESWQNGTSRVSDLITLFSFKSHTLHHSSIWLQQASVPLHMLLCINYVDNWHCCNRLLFNYLMTYNQRWRRVPVWRTLDRRWPVIASGQLANGSLCQYEAPPCVLKRRLDL